MENDALQRHYENLACEGGFEARCHMELPERSLVGARVVNVGCRRGKGTYKLSEQVGESGFVIGADWSEEFVEAARACGAKDNIIIFKHILPNSMAPLIIRATLGIGAGVTAVSSLSYLGLGIAPHIPEWGNILKAGSSYLESNPYMAIFPGFAIVILVLAFNFLGDGFRDALDPKLK